MITSDQHIHIVDMGGSINEATGYPKNGWCLRENPIQMDDDTIDIYRYGGFRKWGYPNSWMVYNGRIPSRNGWWLGVPLPSETSTNNHRTDNLPKLVSASRGWKTWKALGRRENHEAKKPPESNCPQTWRLTIGWYVVPCFRGNPFNPC